jgi:hypothetical protein
VLDNVQDCDLDGWHGRKPQWGCSAGVANVCSQDWDIVNNEFRNTGGIIGCQGGGGGACNDRRPVRDVRWDRNVYINDRPAEAGHERMREAPLDNIWEAGTLMSIGGFGDSLEETCQELTITNNVFHWKAAGLEAGIVYFAGGRQDGGAAVVPGEIVISNNTFHGHIQDSSKSAEPAGYIVLTGKRGASDLRIENNIFAGGSRGCRNIVKDRTWGAGGAAVIGHNIYGGSCGFEWDGKPRGFRGWKSMTGDTGSQTCSPNFVDVAAEDFHLDSADECAIDTGRPSASPIDLDGDPRPARTAWDVGADEVTP